MNNDKRTTRELALIWFWDELTYTPRNKVANKYFPKLHKTLTDEDIEFCYLSEHPHTEAKKEDDEDKEIEKLEADLWNSPTGTPPIKEEPKEGDILEGGGEKEGTTQKVATALLRHASNEHKLVSEYTQTEKQMFRAGFIHGDVQGNESGCIWGLEQGKAENTSLKTRIVVLEDALRKIICEDGEYRDADTRHGIATKALNQK